MDSVDPYGLVGRVLERKFRIDRKVAEGGFGLVYQGHHLGLEKPIAIKVLKLLHELTPEAYESISKKFRLEAQLIARLSHPAIVQSLDFDVTPMPSGGYAPWMVLEWVDGPTLRQWLRARPGGPALPPIQALSLLRPVFEAVACAHEEGVAHRDIKTTNIMVETRRHERLRLLDFGIAKLMEEGRDVAQVPLNQQNTVTSSPSYSASYAAPEQPTGRKTGPWTDVHALALLLTEVLIGTRAYRANDPASLLGETINARRPTPGNQSPSIDVGPWEPVIARALHLNPGERYPNAAEFLAALENTMPASGSRAGEGVTGRGAQSGYAPMSAYHSASASGQSNPYRGYDQRSAQRPMNSGFAPNDTSMSAAHTVLGGESDTSMSDANTFLGGASDTSMSSVHTDFGAQATGASAYALPTGRNSAPNTAPFGYAPLGAIATGQRPVPAFAPAPRRESRVGAIIAGVLAIVAIGAAMGWLTLRRMSRANVVVAPSTTIARPATPPAVPQAAVAAPTPSAPVVAATAPPAATTTAATTHAGTGDASAHGSHHAHATTHTQSHEPAHGSTTTTSSPPEAHPAVVHMD